MGQHEPSIHPTVIRNGVAVVQTSLLTRTFRIALLWVAVRLGCLVSRTDSTQLRELLMQIALALVNKGVLVTTDSRTVQRGNSPLLSPNIARTLRFRLLSLIPTCPAVLRQLTAIVKRTRLIRVVVQEVVR